MGAARTHGALVTILTGILLLGGALEITGAILDVSANGVGAVAAHSGPGALLPFTAAALLGSVGGRSARIAGFFGAIVALVARLVLVALLLVPGWTLVAHQLFTAAAGIVTGIAVAGFALCLVLRHRDLSNAPAPAEVPSAQQTTQRQQAQPRPQPRPAPVPAQATSPARRGPESPATPVDEGLRARTGKPGAWATARTPWPRANEEDPNGTLIRPPRR